jgi:predicted DNA binding CopG/RHH family protein
MFSWDIRKAITNFEKHGVPFEEAARGLAMEKKRSGLSAHDKRAGRSAKHIPDSQIDFSDIPESTDEELKRARRVGRPKSGSAKQLIAIRVDPKLLASLRKMAAKLGKPYQTLIHELLEKATRRAA